MRRYRRRDSEPRKITGQQAQALLKHLLALARPEWRSITVGTLFLLLGSAMGLAYPQAIRVIVDKALAPGGLALIDRAAFVMLGLFTVQAVAIAVRHYVFTVSGERVVTRLREQLYRAIIAQEIAFFDERRTGELVSRLGSDTTVLQNTVSVNISVALRNFAATLGGIALLLYSSPRLSVLILAVVPPLVVGTLVFSRRIRRLSRELQDELAKAGEVAEETIAGIRTVRAFARERQESERYGAAVQRTFVAARKRTVQMALFGGIASFAAYAAVALVLWYGGRMVAGGAMSVGDLTAFILYTLIVAFSLGELGSLWADFMRAAGAAERIFELLERKALMFTEGGERLPQVLGRVELTQVAFAYPSRPDMRVLTGIDLVMAPGEVVALVGPSGGGKSTIAALIGRFYDPQAGRLALDGHDLKDLDATWLREQIGVVAQEPILFSTTIADNIRYGRPAATDDEVEAAARAANAYPFVKTFPAGFATLVGERGVMLSAGQKQRVAIARALLKNPRLLILDEATSALDAESEHLVREALERLMVGRTTLIIAHRLSTVVGADRVVVIDQGRVIQSGSHSRLMQEELGLYRRLVERQLVPA